MKFRFDKPQCQNIRKAIRKEWILSNGLGSYASSTILGCNTRKYHGLFTVNLKEPAGRFVLLSTLEESIVAQNKEFYFSSRQHPNVYYPKGHEYLESVDVSDWPVFEYSIGPLVLRREIIMPYKQDMTLLRYTAFSSEKCPDFTLKIKPLLAFRDMHALTYENTNLNTSIEYVKQGFKVRPYPSLPEMTMYVENARAGFKHELAWCKQVQYLVEEERGFDFEEDLCSLGVFEIDLKLNTPVYIAVTTKSQTSLQDTQELSLADIWIKEAQGKQEINANSQSLIQHLKKRGERFISLSAHNNHAEIIAGYPWFQAWGRDTLISLSGLTFASQRFQVGKDILRNMIEHIQHGLMPNMFSSDGNNSYNTIDASLWFVLAMQNFEKYMPYSSSTDKEEEKKEDFIRTVCYPALRRILSAYYKEVYHDLPYVFVNQDGLLHAGSKESQLTWMDAHAYGKAVTPRYGYAVEINALWYNALAYCLELGQKYNDPPPFGYPDLMHIRKAFRNMFWVEEHGGYLADSCNEEGQVKDIRPNQIFAASLPFPILDENDQACVVEIVRNHLLTPYGLRTLSPHSQEYKGKYAGNTDERDSAYHQGTVWPWLLGAYGDALLRTTWDTDGAVLGLLNTLTPLFSTHLADAGLGTLSEIFSGDPPHLPDGCISQAWSVAECFRLLQNLQAASPKIYADWEEKINFMYS